MTENLRALLLTDVVDSTKMSEQLGDAAMAVVWAGNDRVARDLLPVWRGREIDKTDGMLLMFDSAADAVAYAQAYHRAIGALPVPRRARAGLHVGAVILRENAAYDVARGAKPLEVDGLAKPTAARVMSLANGGQTLLTPEALQALGDTELVTQSHGHWVMKGVSEPVELFEIGADPGRFEAPLGSDKVYRVVRSGERWLPVVDIPNNLPQQPTAFIGREKELKDLKAKLAAGARLITLLGMGGLGKTRLSLQVAAETLHAYPDGAWFIDLTAIRDPALVASVTARALDIADEPGRPLLDTLCAQMRHRRLILVFDNCEHLVESAGDLIYALLKAASHIKVLASSRELLDVPGEQSYPIQPLPLPNRGDGVQALLRSTAARLFVDRVLAHRPDYTLQDEDAADVADLVVRLEGIPLAIELAAARMRTLDVGQINEGLRQRFDVLTGGSRRLQARQQTLRGLVDWSYDMLSAPERTVFDRLAVFAGGFDADAALEVCGVDPVSAEEVPALLQSLTEKSLIALVGRDAEPRWRMLETIRDYAAEKLAAGGDRVGAAARHCGHFFVLAKQARNGMQGPEQGDWLDRLDTEHDNLRAAMAVAQGNGSGVDALVSVKLVVALQNFWIMRGHISEGRAAVRALLGWPPIQASEMAQAHALYVGATLACSQSELGEAERLLQECLALRRRLSNEVDVAATLSTLAVTNLSSGDLDGALAAATEAVQLFRRCGYRNGEAISLLQLGQIEAYQGRTAEALQHLQEALALAREIKHPETEGEAELALGELQYSAGCFDDAQQDFERSLAVCQAAGDRRGSASAQWALSRMDLRAGRLDAAASRLREALLAFDSFEMRDAWLGCLCDHALLALRWGEDDLAVGLASAAQRLREAAGLARSPQAVERGQSLLAELRTADREPALSEAWRRAQGWGRSEVQRLAQGLTRTMAAAA